MIHTTWAAVAVHVMLQLLPKHLHIEGNAEEIPTTPLRWWKHMRVRNVQHRCPLKQGPHVPLCSAPPPPAHHSGPVQGVSGNIQTEREKIPEFHKQVITHCFLCLKPNQTLTDLPVTSGFNAQLFLPIFNIFFSSFAWLVVQLQTKVWLPAQHQPQPPHRALSIPSHQAVLLKGDNSPQGTPGKSMPALIPGGLGSCYNNHFYPENPSLLEQLRVSPSSGHFQLQRRCFPQSAVANLSQILP